VPVGAAESGALWLLPPTDGRAFTSASSVELLIGGSSTARPNTASTATLLSTASSVYTAVNDPPSCDLGTKTPRGALAPAGCTAAGNLQASGESGESWRPQLTPLVSQPDDNETRANKRMRLDDTLTHSASVTPSACAGVATPVSLASPSAAASAEPGAPGIGAVESHPLLFDERTFEDHPALALLREEEMLRHRRLLASAVAVHWPMNKASKTARACHEAGLLEGLQGLHARWCFQQQLRETQ
jgi:hypothetical protein